MSTNNQSRTKSFVFGTKAETLLSIKSNLTEATIPHLYFFSLKEWNENKEAVLNTIHTTFGDNLLAIRSSSLTEDGSLHSMAGAFLSLLNIQCSDRAKLRDAIDQVVTSMTDNPRDQVLIQPMVTDVDVSGVIMTFDMVHGAPYYCIDFDDESGRTDVVTSGQGVHKSLFVYRDVDLEMIKSPRVASFIRLARELENICECAALDIEFGMNRAGQLFLFQVRRITLARNWHPVTVPRVRRQLSHVEEFLRKSFKRRQRLLGDNTIYAIMPDWNPAEIIGTAPRPLAASLYRQLITKGTWCQARASMGYRDLGETDLMVLINHHPYIDVRCSFNSFLPAQISEVIGEKLVNAWLERLKSKPEFHDKVEFDVVPTCLDFCFQEDWDDRSPGILNQEEFKEFRIALRNLTRECLTPSHNNTFYRALEASSQLEKVNLSCIEDKDGYSHLDLACHLLNQCRELGTFSFAIVARHAFIAEAILRSAVRRGALSEGRLNEFKRSIKTISGTMLEDFASVSNGGLSKKDFYKKYGHLRPGTYEITSLRYDERDDLFTEAMPETFTESNSSFELTDTERCAIDRLLTEAGLNVLDADQLVNYANQAIANREYVKFVFTKTLSDALSEVMRWGGLHGLSRDDLSYLTWPDISDSLFVPIIDDIDRHYLAKAEEARISLSSAHALKLGHIITAVRDIYVATLNRSVPNFVGLGTATSKVIELEANTPTSINIKGHIVCIENADPGFDWIFTKSPAALITRFGGANSHMAVRCAEFGLPAAIGCGDQIYQRVIQAGSVELNCAEKILRPLYVK